MHNFQIAATSGINTTYAEQLAQQLQVPFTLLNGYSTHSVDKLTLVFDVMGCALLSPDASMKPVRIDFTSGKADHRRKFGGGKGQMIAKAVGLKPGIYPSVVDATAGLGKDSFVLASLGCELRMLERSPVIAELLRAGISQARDHEETMDIANRMHLIHQDSIDWLQQSTANVADVIYLDPMFPHREKSSLVKKEMRLFRPIVGDDMDAEALLNAALSRAEYRVVVKRPRKAPAIAGQAPSYVLEGKSSRYDIYTMKSLSLLKGVSSTPAQ